MKILFVCLGNICRSPAGENIMRHYAKISGQGSSVICDSAGTINHHAGSPPDDRMTSTIEARGVEVTGHSRQITEDDFTNFDLILTMDEDNYSNVMLLNNAQDLGHKVKRFTDFCTQHDDTHVPDPYYGGQQGFEHVADLLEDGCKNILAKVELGEL